MTCGVVYTVWGNDYYYLPLEASIKQLRKVSALPITVMSTDAVDMPGVNNIIVDYYDDLRAGEYEKCFKTKLYARDHLPYDVNIYVDTDTFFFEDPSQLIRDDYDLGGCRETSFKEERLLPHGPKLFNALNSGFLIIHNNDEWKKLHKKSCELYELAESQKLDPVPSWLSLKHVTDQWAINHALVYSYTITAKIFQQRWNIRTPDAATFKNPAMIHGPRDPDFIERYETNTAIYHPKFVKD